MPAFWMASQAIKSLQLEPLSFWQLSLVAFLVDPVYNVYRKHPASGGSR